MPDPTTSALLVLLVFAAPLLLAWRAAERRKAAGAEVPRPLRITIRLLVLGLLVGGPCALVYAIVGPSWVQEQRHATLVRDGVRAEGTILRFAETDNVVNGHPEMQLWVQVEPRSGRPFRAAETFVASWSDLQRYRAGVRVEVAYLPSDPATLAVVRVVSVPAAE